MERYAVEYPENKQYAYVHFSVKLPPIGLFSKKDEAGEVLKKQLESIPGVMEVIAYRHRLSIQRGGAFTWEEVLPKVVELVFREMDVEEYEEVYPFVE